jgi:hypothetical protein
MGFRDSDRLEYLKQPQIIALMLLIVLVIAGALFTAGKKIIDINRRTAAGTEAACLEFIDDPDLCKFAAASESTAQRSYRSVMTVVEDSSTAVTTTDYENADRSRWVVQLNGQETDAFIMLDADGYVRDRNNGDWAHYHDDSFAPTDSTATIEKFDFTKADSEDVKEFRDNYRRVGEESCGDLECYKYEIVLKDDEDSKILLWFDKNEYLLRRYQTQETASSTNTQYSYEPVSITAPSPVRTVSEEEFNAFLE